MSNKRQFEKMQTSASARQDQTEDESSQNGVPNILKNIWTMYVKGSKQQSEALIEGKSLDKESLHLRELLRDGLVEDGQICLICLEVIRHEDPIWNCEGCYNIYHLFCIQQWVKEGVHLRKYQQSLAQDAEKVTIEDCTWCCPKCRKEYLSSECPKEYFCFCGKVVNPPNEAWELPHSCGQSCGKALARCKHTCLLLCHPGACPPCPKIVREPCFCKRSKPLARRCGSEGWSCGSICGKGLSCELHACSQFCHPEECPLCQEISEQPCYCKKKRTERPCSEPKWSCGKPCGKMLSCGRHKCQKVCHDHRSEEPCVEDGSSTCPCGKTFYDSIGCIDEQPCCGDTCDKLLPCKLHRCIERCHRGKCPTEWHKETVLKQCRCGAREKDVPCLKEYLCETKCKRVKDCGRHTCNRKCCDQNCGPCEQICGKTLPCKNHKCEMKCHSGLCYPCPVVVEVFCRCKTSKIRVPCGKESSTKPPRCQEKCNIPPDCHHPQRAPHKCHFGKCPSCRLICGKSLKGCGHPCPLECHSAVLTDVNKSSKVAPATPLEIPVAKMELVTMPCQPCQVPIQVSCLGNHEISTLPCCAAKPYSCGRLCGNVLKCDNHECRKVCHDKKKVPCEEPCGEPCNLPRPPKCTHKCSKHICHPPPCPTCSQMVKCACHCGLSQKYIPCPEWGSATEEFLREELSCGDKCPKLMTCGHRCLKMCHDGVCSSAKDCKKKLTVYCKCKRLKQQIKCYGSTKMTTLPCDEECKAQEKSLIGNEVKDEAASSERPGPAASELRRRKEAEELERKFGAQKSKKKKDRSASVSTKSKFFSVKWIVPTLGAVIFCATVVVLVLPR